jgi:surface protein
MGRITRHRNGQNIQSMFYDAELFNGDISKWDVSRVTDMSGMFYEAKSFNGDISKWRVSRVNNVREMFQRAEPFNGDISKWDVARVTNMDSMFHDVKLFNGDISKWDVSRVENMYRMFESAKMFKHQLCGSSWVHSKASKESMFAGSSGSTSRTVSVKTEPPYVSRRPMPERELIARAPTTTSVGTPA